MGTRHFERQGPNINKTFEGDHPSVERGGIIHGVYGLRSRYVEFTP